MCKSCVCVCAFLWEGWTALQPPFWHVREVHISCHYLFDRFSSNKHAQKVMRSLARWPCTGINVKPTVKWHLKEVELFPFSSLKLLSSKAFVSCGASVMHPSHASGHEIRWFWLMLKYSHKLILCQNFKKTLIAYTQTCKELFHIQTFHNHRPLDLIHREIDDVTYSTPCLLHLQVLTTMWLLWLQPPEQLHMNMLYWALSEAHTQIYRTAYCRIMAGRERTNRVGQRS